MKINRPSSEQIGTECLDIDVALITEAESNAIKQLVYEHKLVILRYQDLNEDQYLKFAEKIGTPQIYLQSNYHHPNYPEIFVSSNIPRNGQKIGVPGTGRYWHTDCAFLDEPLPFTMLYPQVIPNSIRETYYIDMQQIYQKLPSSLRSYVDGKYMIHEAKWRYKVQECDVDRALIDILKEVQEKAPPVKHPAIITHPVTRAKILYMSEGFTTGIVGLSYEENQEILQTLFSFIERAEHIYTHTWKEGDILLWDNRYLIHKASTVSKGEKSESYRIGIHDGLPFYVSNSLNENAN
jgi:taurine dioxygenase